MKRMAAIIALGAGGLALGGCGNRGDLRPAPGQALPLAAYGVDHRPAAADLLKRPAQANPQRSTELRTRSEERQDDPFNLPPP